MIQELVRELKAQLYIFTTVFFFVLIYSYLTGTATNCYFKEVVGVACPLCGGTRALYCVTKFQFIEAWKYNPYIYVLPVYVFVTILSLIKKDRELRTIASIINILLLAGIWLIRLATGNLRSL